MRILLDTQVFLWLQAAPSRFGDAALALLENVENQLLLSAASSWEIAIKYALGKLPLPSPPAVYVPDRMLTSGITALPVHHHHALAVANLEPHHRDPFDRLLVAQAQAEGLPLITADPGFGLYGVEILDAR